MNEWKKNKTIWQWRASYYLQCKCRKHVLFPARWTSGYFAIYCSELQCHLRLETLKSASIGRYRIQCWGHHGDQMNSFSHPCGTLPSIGPLVTEIAVCVKILIKNNVSKVDRTKHHTHRLGTTLWPETCLFIIGPISGWNVLGSMWIFCPQSWCIKSKKNWLTDWVRKSPKRQLLWVFRGLQ